MPYDDEKKYEIILKAIKKKLYETENLENLLAFLKSLTKAKLKNIVLEALQEKIEGRDGRILLIEDMKSADEALKKELEEEL